MNMLNHVKPNQANNQTLQFEETTAAISLQIKMRRAKTSVMAAKYAYVVKQSLWNKLKEQAIAHIKQCPQAMQAELFQKLYALSSPKQVLECTTTCKKELR